MPWELQAHLDKVRAKRDSTSKDDDDETDWDSPNFEKGDVPPEWRNY